MYLQLPFTFLVLRLLAKLDKADRALSFTSGMAALSAVTHLVGTGTHHLASSYILIAVSVKKVYLNHFPYYNELEYACF